MLKQIKFGNDICECVDLFFKEKEGRNLLGGHLTDINLLEQGVPQGNIISPFIFFKILVEILLIKITKSKHIKGIQMSGKECKAQTIADDTTLTI